MLILLLFIPLLMCILPDTKSRSFADALTHERLLPWKGMCVLLILLSHYTGYITTSPSDETYLLIRSGMGQTVVVLFFFAAGYGMTLQLTSKGKGYLPRILQKGLRLWILNAAAVFLMLMVQTLRGREYELSTILLAFVPLVNLGNSPWFIFAMLLCYLFFLLSAVPYLLRPSRPRLFLLFLLHTVLCCAYIFIISRQSFDDYWYDTILLFPFGILAACIQSAVFKDRSPGALTWSALLSLSMTAVAFFYCFQTRSFVLHELYMLSACSLLLVCAMHYSPGSRLLAFLGRHALSIYLFQRIPMILFYETGLMDMVPHLAFFPVFSCVCLIALAVETIQMRIKKARSA